MERVQVRDEVIRKLETFHKNVIDNIPSGILTTDLSGRITLNNDSACAILGKAPEELGGRPLQEILGGIDGDAERPRRGEPTPPRPEIRFVRPDGTEIFLGFSASQMKDPDGNVIGRVVVFQDLTPIKQMEERVRIADRLAGVGEMAAGLAHEIRNPLASIAGSSQLLREAADVPEDAATLLEIIERESKRLNVLISDFLSFTGTSLRSLARVRVTSLLREIAEAVRAGEAREKGLQVEDLATKELSVEGDAEQLRQVVWNLVRNAVQSTPPGGRVLLDAYEQIRQGTRYAVLTVSDSGVGIEPQDLERIFNPFFTTKEGGTGLGLSISQRIVHHHKGVHRGPLAPRAGEHFSVFLPVLSGEETGGGRMPEGGRASVVGAGLAGSEAALRLARAGIGVDLFEMRPGKSTEAHRTGRFAELVCSNSLGSEEIVSGKGLLKEELRLLGSALLPIADASRVPAGKALAVDRERFAQG
jgi:two-component system sensor histidine kinase PilS (NtrC family)